MLSVVTIVRSFQKYSKKIKDCGAAGDAYDKAFNDALEHGDIDKLIEKQKAFDEALQEANKAGGEFASKTEGEVIKLLSKAAKAGT